MVGLWVYSVHRIEMHRGILSTTSGLQTTDVGRMTRIYNEQTSRTGETVIGFWWVWRDTVGQMAAVCNQAWIVSIDQGKSRNQRELWYSIADPE